jgi:hypothetical protein
MAHALNIMWLYKAGLPLNRSSGTQPTRSFHCFYFSHGFREFRTLLQLSLAYLGIVLVTLRTNAGLQLYLIAASPPKTEKKNLHCSCCHPCKQSSLVVVLRTVYQSNSWLAEVFRFPFRQVEPAVKPISHTWNIYPQVVICWRLRIPRSEEQSFWRVLVNVVIFWALEFKIIILNWSLSTEEHLALSDSFNVKENLQSIRKCLP